MRLYVLYFQKEDDEGEGGRERSACMPVCEVIDTHLK